MRGSAPRPRLDALAERLSRRAGVPIEVAAAVVAEEARRVGASHGRFIRWMLVERSATRRLRELRVEAEVEHETLPKSEVRSPDEVALDAWRRDSWLE